MFIVAGLGNPGRKYEETRHNVGFLTIDYLAYKNKILVSKPKFKSLVGEGAINGEKVVLLKPQTYMNNSGEAIRDIVDFYKQDISKLIVIYDDVDLETGGLRIRAKGSSGTHNGMRSILYHLETENFPRVRIGIGRPPEFMDMAAYVLGKFNKDERETIIKTIEAAASSVEEIIASGTEKAMMLFNKKAKTDEL